MTAKYPHDLQAPQAALLIIDIQEKLSKTMNADYLNRTVVNINLLATLAVELKIPLFLTEQYPQGLGPTIGPIKKILEGKKFELMDKISFGCSGDTNFNKKLKSLKRSQIILTGMETHVCVYLTALGLMQNGYHPFVASDAVLSRATFNYKNGLQLMRDMGAVVSNTETLLFQLMRESGTDLFRKISSLLKEKK